MRPRGLDQDKVIHKRAHLLDAELKYLKLVEKSETVHNEPFLSVLWCVLLYWFCHNAVENLGRPNRVVLRSKVEDANRIAEVVFNGILLCTPFPPMGSRFFGVVKM